MPGITLRILDGADRGRIFENLAPPITIGREEGNSIQLNDERVSRYHVKIQEDHDRLVLTDLESTNGTKVNGEDIQLRILRYGDLVTIGRSVILFGSRDEIADRLARLRGRDESDATLDPREAYSSAEGGSAEFDVNWASDSQLQATLHALEPPELPERLSPGQAAQLAELLDYLHIRIRRLLTAARVDAKTEKVGLDQLQWQNLIDVQSRLAEYLRGIGEPDQSAD